MTKYRHLDLYERTTLEQMLNKNCTVSEIARYLKRDPKTLRDEILRNRINIFRGGHGKGANNCKHRESCQHVAGEVCKVCLQVHTKRLCRYCGRCCLGGECSEYEEDVCPRLVSSPFVCNSCPKQANCRLKRYRYRAKLAQHQAEQRASDARRGVATSLEELKRMNEVISSGVKRHQSLNHILENNKDDIPCSLRTVYNYIHQGVMDVTDLDLKEKVSRRPRYKKREHKVDQGCYQGRTYQDYLNYRAENPHLCVIQMDCVEGLMSEPLTVLNLFNPQFHLYIIRRLERLTARQVRDQLSEIRSMLGQDLFDHLFAIILTDRGSEFTDPKQIEALGMIKVFYCDPQRSDQKASIERSNREIRRVLPKGYSLQALKQEDLVSLSSHLNSYTYPSLGNKTPYDLFALSYGMEPLENLGIKKIPPQDIVLNRSLMGGNVKRI